MTTPARPRNAPVEAPPRHYSERLDTLTGFWAGIQLAVGLATVTAVVTIGLLVPWLWLSDNAAGTSIAENAHNPQLLLLTAWWSAFWFALSLLLLAGLWLGYRAWETGYPLVRRVRRSRQAAREQRAAVEAAEAILDEARARLP